MLGKEHKIQVQEALKLHEAFKLTDSAKDLTFQTSYKLARFGTQFPPILKAYNKKKEEPTEKFKASAGTPEDATEFTKVITELNEEIVEVTVPEFKFSEFVYGKNETPVNKGKLKVPQKFINIMFEYIEYDLTEETEERPTKRPKKEVADF